MQQAIKLLIISSDKTERDVLNFCFDGWGYEVTLWDNMPKEISPIKTLSPDAIIIDVHSARKPQLELCKILKDDFSTMLIPIITLINKRHLREQLLHLKYGVDDYLIKPPDPLDLRIRVEMAMRRSQHCSNTNALTGLPGARAIEADVKARIKRKEHFTFAYTDIDNFKCFNDVYGYVKGDNVILHTAYMIYSSIKNFGNKGDFIGHIGGDDFAFITTPDKYKKVCEEFINYFNNSIPYHYNSKDREKGFIVAMDRNRQARQIDLMGISVAVVNRKDQSDITNMIQLNERVAEIKKYLKSIPDSKFMVDRRSQERKKDCGPHVFQRNKEFIKNYRPLGQILVDENIISEDQLSEALKAHWKRGIVFGEILKQLGFVHEEKLELALNIQNSLLNKVRS